VSSIEEISLLNTSCENQGYEILDDSSNLNKLNDKYSNTFCIVFCCIKNCNAGRTVEDLGFGRIAPEGIFVLLLMPAHEAT
jgi:hypothetical protein